MANSTIFITDEEEIATYLLNRHNPFPLVGTQYDRLTFNGNFGVSYIKHSNGVVNRMCHLECVCTCGTVKFFQEVKLRTKATRSCGCLAREITSERRKSNPLKYEISVKKYPLYRVWQGMRARCEKPSDKKYCYYGARGIVVCEEWLEFANFERWSLANGYTLGLTIDRRDGDLGYCPANCRWVDYATQNRNYSRNINVTILSETKCVTDWVNDSRTAIKTLNTYHARINEGYTPEDALMTPYRRNGGKSRKL
jgi:hypothetical protein